jgi:hypothetical protein
MFKVRGFYGITIINILILSLKVPSKPLTLDLMETFDIFFRFAKSAHFVLSKVRTKFIQRSYGSCKSRSKVSVDAKLEAFMAFKIVTVLSHSLDFVDARFN